MIKYGVLAGAVLIASPALAQQTPTKAPGSTQTAPTTSNSIPQTAPVQTAPDQTATPQSTDAIPAAGQSAPTSPEAKVAQVVEADFPTYDKNGDGVLSKSEFGAWMASLRANDPEAKPGSAALKKWVDQAFTQTDTDKSKSVSKTELASFLVQGQGASQG